MALSISRTLLPLITFSVCHPIALNRSKTFSVKVLDVSPSKLTLLESYKTIKLFKFNVPANEAAS
jgi:hypothetical protein